MKSIRRIPKYLKKLHTDLSKRDRYQENYLYGIDQLFNEDVHYKPVEVKSAFNSNYYMNVMVIKLGHYLY